MEVCLLFDIARLPVLPLPALPCLALPCLALPRLASPCLASPCLALPCLALPCLYRLSAFVCVLPSNESTSSQTGGSVVQLYPCELRALVHRRHQAVHREEGAQHHLACIFEVANAARQKQQLLVPHPTKEQRGGQQAPQLAVSPNAQRNRL